jgi:hypothetical protein
LPVYHHREFLQSAGPRWFALRTGWGRGTITIEDLRKRIVQATVILFHGFQGFSVSHTPVSSGFGSMIALRKKMQPMIKSVVVENTSRWVGQNGCETKPDFGKK